MSNEQAEKQADLLLTPEEIDKILGGSKIRPIALKNLIINRKYDKVCQAQIDKLRSLNLLRTGEEVELDTDQSLPQLPISVSYTDERGSRSYILGFQDAIKQVEEMGYKKVGALTHK